MARRYGSFPQWHIKHFHAHDRPLPAFPALSLVHESICLAGHDIPAHAHAHKHFEICYIHSGKANWFAEGRTYRLKAGDIYITRPGEIHGGGTDPQDPYHIFAVALDVSALPLQPFARSRPPRQLEARRGHDAGGRDVAQAMQEAELMQGDFGVPHARVIPGGEGLEQIFRRLLEELDAPVQSNAKARALKVMMVQALLVELLVFVARCGAAQAEKRMPEGALQLPSRPRFRALLEKIRSEAAEPMTLPQMAEYVGLSPSHFAVAFKRETGRTPLEAVTRIRIDEAARRLALPGRIAVTDVALDLGFSSAQYFSMVFRKWKGCSPTEWRRKNFGTTNSKSEARNPK
ncbi:MAG: AraC family transcriptional regulator [Planctomycetes bacterium]|nr:AraC family transcriptional regulator [Planctomycetota bacterium]